MYSEDNISVVIIDPRVFGVKQLVQNLQEEIQELADEIAEFINEFYRILQAAETKIGEEIARIAAELEDLDAVPPNIKRPERGHRQSSNINHRRLGMVLWYTSGFQ